MQFTDDNTNGYTAAQLVQANAVYNEIEGLTELNYEEGKQLCETILTLIDDKLLAVDIETVVPYMDDQRREGLHDRLSPCSEMAFWVAYCSSGGISHAQEILALSYAEIREMELGDAL